VPMFYTFISPHKWKHVEDDTPPAAATVHAPAE